MTITPAQAQLGGSAISAVAGLIAGRKNRKESRRIRAQQQAQFDAMMDQTVQRRVKDAQAAGIHPLAALGVSPSSGPTITGVGAGAEGEAIARAGEAAGRGIAGAAMAKANLQLIESQTSKNEAEAAYWRSEATRKSGLNPGTDGGNIGAVESAKPVVSGQQVPGPAIYESPRHAKNRPGVPEEQAGTSPMFRRHNFGNGHTGRLFTEESGAEDLNNVLAPIHSGVAAAKGMYRDWKRHASYVASRARKSEAYKNLTKAQKRVIEREIAEIKSGRPFPRSRIY